MALTNGANLGLLINGSPGEEHYNKLMEQWRGLDALVQAVAKDKDLTIPPNPPTNGDVFVVGFGAVGAWTGKDNQIARFSSAVASWEFYIPKKGWQIFVQDEDMLYRFDGISWHVSGGAATVYPSPIAPSNPEPGDFWLDTSSLTLAVFYDDGSSQQWVDVTGSRGPEGPPGGTTTFIYEQDTAQSIWGIEHNLDKFPSVVVTDTDKNVLFADVKYIDANNIEVAHSAPIAGFCFLN